MRRTLLLNELSKNKSDRKKEETYHLFLTQN